ncbi:MAG: hypothetical protein LUE87_01620, partial [Lachnospiraceae bacterium]|nr:hypothetical protein [Lachnospiraceae bacterium]
MGKLTDLEKGMEASHLDQVMSIHAANDREPYYQEMNSPFSIYLMAIHPECMSDNAFSIFTPETQLNLPSGAIQGHERMHQHNCFEFTYVLQGNVYRIIEGKRYLYPAGSCCLINR